jgi:hypothetical protein
LTPQKIDGGADVGGEQPVIGRAAAFRSERSSASDIHQGPCVGDAIVRLAGTGS